MSKSTAMLGFRIMSLKFKSCVNLVGIIMVVIVFSNIVR